MRRRNRNGWWLVFCAWLFPLLLTAQEAGDAQSVLSYIKHAMRFSLFYPQEKVYLHLDNTGYFIGETIWFKAYVTRVDTEQATDLSKVLYVELLNPSGDVVEHRKLQIENGVAYGDIKVDSVMVTGFYEIRAFTRYMTNWGTNACFSRVLPIFNAPKQEGDYSNPLIDQISYRHRLNNERLGEGDAGNGNIVDLSTINDKTKVDKEKSSKVKVHFYPEGGNIVKGLPCRVAIAVSDGDGVPMGVPFSVVDASGNVVASDSTNADGRGEFMLSGSEVGAQLLVQRSEVKEKTFRLPAAQPDGCAMQVDVMRDDSVLVRLHTSASVQGQKMGYVLLNKGKVVRCDTLTAQSQQTFTFDRSKLPEGVSQLTFFGSDGRVMAERQFFIFPTSKVSSIKVTATNATIKPCGKVAFQLQTEPNASLSFSAVDAQGMVNGKEGNIFTWMLLASDLKGYIAHPDYYLESDDAVHRQATDLLMLVQGWRRYDWQLMTGQSLFDKYQTIETQLFLFGQLKSKGLKKKPVDKVWLDAKMFNHAGQVVEGTTQTDSLGNYVFSLPDIMGEWNLSLNTGVADKKGYWKDVDYYVGINRHFSPKAKYVSPQEAGYIPVDDGKKFKWTMKDKDEGWVSITKKDHVLQNVTVKAKGRVWDRTGWSDESTARKASNIYYNCDEDADRIADEGQEQPHLVEWLKSKNSFFSGEENPMELVPFYYEIPPDSPLVVYTDGPSYKNRPIVWIVDNTYWTITQVSSSLLNRQGKSVFVNNNPMLTRFSSEDSVNNDVFLEWLDISIDWVKSVYISEDLEKAHTYFYSPEVDAANPVVVYVYTHRSAAYKQKGIRNTHFQGYSEPSVFQMEDYSVIPPMEDFRRTLFWSPHVKTDGQGRATVEFWNNSSCHEMYISCEGMTPEGKFLVNE